MTHIRMGKGKGQRKLCIPPAVILEFRDLKSGGTEYSQEGVNRRPGCAKSIKRLENRGNHKQKKQLALEARWNNPTEY